jgi:hypothetical protein
MRTKFGNGPRRDPIYEQVYNLDAAAKESACVLKAGGFAFRGSAALYFCYFGDTVFLSTDLPPICSSTIASVAPGLRRPVISRDLSICAARHWRG